MKSEFELIKRLKRKIPRHLQGAIPIGDDAGMMKLPAGPLVVSTDAIVDGVDFEMKKLPPQKVGRKALAVNLSDMAAMGASPVAFVITLGIPKNTKEAWVLSFYDGLIQLAEEFDVKCLGGDLSSAKQLFASVTIFGQGRENEILRREGASSGDWIAVTGELGGSIREHHYAFTPRVAEARFLAQAARPSAMIDISDGLVQDLGHILEASGVGAVLDLGKIPVSKAAGSLEAALTDGEDFELLFTVNPNLKPRLEQIWKKEFPEVRLSFIGKIRYGRGIRYKKNGKDVVFNLKKKGFSHFS